MGDIVLFCTFCAVVAVACRYIPRDPDVAAKGVGVTFAVFIFGLLFLTGREGWRRQQRKPSTFGKSLLWILGCVAAVIGGAMIRPDPHEKDILGSVISLVAIWAVFTIAQQIGILAAIAHAKRKK